MTAPTDQSPKTDLNRFISEQRAKLLTDDSPLKGLRVIDLATVVAGPFAATLLGDYGAEVIKIENPKAPDATRSWGIDPASGVGPFWAVFGRNKFPIALDLKSEAGKTAFMDLIKKSDVLVQNMRPGTLDRLGLGPDKLIGLNPGLIVASVTGYGATGPYSARPGFGTLAEGFSGFTYLNAHPGGPPTNAPMALADLICGVHTALGVMMALRGQERGVKGGQEIDLALYEPLFGMLGPDYLSYFLTGVVPQPLGNELTYVAPRNSYQTRDGKWVGLSGAAQKPFERLMEAAGHPEMNSDPRYMTNEERIKDDNRAVVNQVIADWIGSMDLPRVLAECERLGVTVGPLMSMADIEADPHYRDRGSMVELTDPASGSRLKMPNLPFRMPSRPGAIRFPGLPVGAANQVVFREILGYSEEKTAQLAG